MIVGWAIATRDGQKLLRRGWPNFPPKAQWLRAIADATGVAPLAASRVQSYDSVPDAERAAKLVGGVVVPVRALVELAGT